MNEREREIKEKNCDIDTRKEIDEVRRLMALLAFAK